MDRAVYIALSKSGDSQAVINFSSASGSVASTSEHAIIEQLYGVDGISAVKAIQLANLQGLRTYNITSSNLASVLPILQVPDAIKIDIQNAVNAGKEVRIPERELQVNQWTGVGYIVSDPTTGAAGYLISGGIAGGSMVIAQDLEQVQAKQDRLPTVLECTILLVVTLVALYLSMVFSKPTKNGR